MVAAAGRRVQVSLDFVQEKSTQIGALLIMRDAESVRRIGDEIEMSRRLSASGRVTGGVAHEVKNPINAIVLHLQLLQNKLAQLDPDTRRHMDIIGSEIHRLDRVVQTLVDFMRARELRLEEVDLRRVLDDVALLAAPDAEQHGVTIKRDMPKEPLPIKADLDFMKQALLNVVLNGILAMPDGGPLTISARREEDAVVAEVRDQGVGIAQDVQDKIFELYFTTRKDGNGIGLAQTYQILQWHYGSVEFESSEGEGTTFRFRLPLAGSSLIAERTADSRDEPAMLKLKLISAVTFRGRKIKQVHRTTRTIKDDFPCNPRRLSSDPGPSKQLLPESARCDVLQLFNLRKPVWRLIADATRSIFARSRTPRRTADHPANQPKPAPKPHHRKKASTSNCTTAAPAPNPGSFRLRSALSAAQESCPQRRIRRTAGPTHRRHGRRT